ncbi:hypothetical protein [Halobacillus sp. BBL2006]|uniref:hypothetical protein n=1 Tax=Halobacillus sp. BBL2006 TaxID=1543706 RepID=UPI000541BBF7|nr:hypothetical protein [Halobacillus sp. BBL2006]KHE72522.1 hypothetical protein LD39_04070 [Halobacillus sp. BBL2006]
MLRALTVIMLSIFFMTACGLQMDKYQGQTSRDDVENMGMNERVTTDTENPRLIKYVGDTWGLKQDRELIKKTVNDMPGVTVKRVIIEASRVWVTVDIDGEDKLSKAELEDWKDEIHQAVYKAVPRYDINVKVS